MPKKFSLGRKIVLVILTGMGVAAGLFIFAHVTAEQRYEFDTVNLRMRYCEGSIFNEKCSEPVEHLTAKRLRELKVLDPVSETDARWELIKGFKAGVRGWIGCGREYVSSLGPSTWLTPVSLPVGEDVSKNSWVRWAIQDPVNAKQFWQVQKSLAQTRPWVAAERLRIARIYIDKRGEGDDVDAEALNAEISRSVE